MLKEARQQRKMLDITLRVIRKLLFIPEMLLAKYGNLMKPMSSCSTHHELGLVNRSLKIAQPWVHEQSSMLHVTQLR